MLLDCDQLQKLNKKGGWVTGLPPPPQELSDKGQVDWRCIVCKHLWQQDYESFGYVTVS